MAEVFVTTNNSKYPLIALLALILALIVIMLGAYTRLTDAGLGCPDWPGCYGKLVLPKQQAALQQIQQLFPQTPIVAHKAWTEMTHRYLAGTLGLIILLLAIWSIFRREKIWIVAWLLVAAVVFQALLGMWTVTLKLLPLVVMGHLMGGMTIIALLGWLTLASSEKQLTNIPALNSLKPWAIVGLIIIVLQIFLGAWTSTNYAALACPTFPFCQGTLFPKLDWRNAFDFFHPIGPNYEGGRLAMAARVTIQMAHRYGAFITASYLTVLAVSIVAIKKFRPLYYLGWLLLLLLATQITLGVLNVELLLPMAIAVAHNGVAALLLLTLIAIMYKARDSKTRSMQERNYEPISE